MQKSIEKILVDIITHELDLPANYGEDSRGDIIPCVFIYSQNIKLFNTDKLQICVRTVSSRTWSNRNQVKEIDGVFTEIQDINQSRMMQIDCYSRNNDARDRYPEITMALNSIYAQQQMDLYNFKIGTLTNDVNISGIDGGSDINRFTTTFNVLIHFNKTRSINYYDKFHATAETEQGQVADIHNGST
jgi:hypothetical protein